MIWGKRRFAYAQSAPYQEKMEKLLMSNVAQYPESSWSAPTPMIPSTALFRQTRFVFANSTGSSACKSELPKEIDPPLVADAAKEPFLSRLKFAHRR